MLRNTRYSEWLLPYLEGALDEARRAQLEARLAVDPALAAEARQLARTVGGLRGVATRAPRPENAQVPADLWPHLRARLVLDPAPRPRPRVWWLAGVGAPAAAALLVAAFWLPNRHLLTPPTLAPKQTAVSRPTTASKAVVPSPAVPVTPEPAGLAPPTAAPARSAPMAKVGAAKSGTAASNAPPTLFRMTAPPASPFDLPVPAPRAAQVANSVPTPSIPAPPLAGTVHAARPATPLPPPAMAPAPPPKPPAPAAAVQDRVAPSPTAVAPAVTEGAANDAQRRAKTQANASHFAAPPAPTDAPPALAPDVPGSPDLAVGSLDSWQAALSAAVRAPLWGENEGDAQVNQALTSVREAGMLDDLRARLEARRAQSPRDVVTGRMLAAVYDSGFSKEAALRERRRVSGLEGAGGEDWYALAQAEERAGNGTAARAAYRHALESPVPPSPFHAAIARGK